MKTLTPAPPGFIKPLWAGALMVSLAVRLISAEPWIQQAYVKSSNGDGSYSSPGSCNYNTGGTSSCEYVDGGDNFGSSTAICGDLMVVGAPFEDSDATEVNGDEKDDSETDSGAAYIFERKGSVWTQQAYLKAAGGTEPTYQFGRAVAISGDTVAVGEATAVYVFRRAGGTWRQEARLQGTHTTFNDQFGSSVGISGDTLVIGAREEDSAAAGINGDEANNGSEDSGAAFVFVRRGVSWTQQAYLKASNTGSRDLFGCSVGISGDTIIAGAYAEDGSATGINGSQSGNGATNAGAAYVFQRTGNSWSQQAYLKASNTGGASDSYDYGDYFGKSVAISADTILVGAYGEDSNATGVNGNQSNNSTTLAGAAYVFVRSGSSWSQQAYIKASNPGKTDYFGWSVGLDGDTAVIGAYQEDSSATGINGSQSSNGSDESGAAYVFRRLNGQWSQQAYLKASNSDGDDRFGRAVAVSGNSIIAGANGEDSEAREINGDQNDDSEIDTGAAYVFVSPPPPPISGISRLEQGLILTLQVPAGLTAGVQYSATLNSGPWIDIGNFPESGGFSSFIDKDPARLAGPCGFYRAFFR